jgi:hypothetical protein
MCKAGSRGVACLFCPESSGSFRPSGDAFNLRREVGFERRPQTGHLQSATTRAAPLHSEADREVSPRKTEAIRDLPTLSVAPDLFQRSRVQIPPPLQVRPAAQVFDRSLPDSAGRLSAYLGHPPPAADHAAAPAPAPRLPWGNAGMAPPGTPWADVVRVLRSRVSRITALARPRRGEP